MLILKENRDLFFLFVFYDVLKSNISHLMENICPDFVGLSHHNELLFSESLQITEFIQVFVQHHTQMCISQVFLVEWNVTTKNIILFLVEKTV